MDGEIDVERIVAEDLDFPPAGFPAGPADLSRLSLVCLGHAHIDLGYRWDFRETIHKVAPWTFKGVLDLMDRTPGLTFCQSQMWLYREMQREYPELFQRIREKIKEGTWEVIGGAWCEYDAALPSGEAVIRQHLQGVTYAAEHLGVTRHTVAFFPDSFIEHAATLPQILGGCGFRAYVLCRGIPCPPDRPEETRRAFRWVGPDGTGLVACAPFGAYANPPLTPEYLNGLAPYAHASVCPDELTLYGVGDHGGGPRDADVEALHGLKNWSGAPAWRFGRADDYFDRFSGKVQGASLREHRGPLVSFSTGALASQAQIKRANRMAEWQLLRAEAVAAMGVLLQRKPASPRVDLQEGWRDMLTLQFHDILPGTSVASVYRDARAIYGRVTAKTSELLGDGLARIGARLDTRGDDAALLVVNAGLKPFTGYAATTLPDGLPPSFDQGLRLTHDDGRAVETDGQGRDLLFPVSLPPLGYALFRAAPGKGLPPAEAPPRFRDSVLESRRFRVAFDDETGDIVSLRTPDGTEFLGEHSNTLDLFDEHELATSWVGVPWGARRAMEMESRLAVVAENAFFTTVACTCRSDFSRFTRETTVHHELGRIDLRLRIEWREGNAGLFLGFRPRLADARVRAATAHGHVDVTHRRKPYCIHEWVDLSDGTQGLSVMTDGAYGASHEGGALSLMVIRTARDMDPEMGRGLHELRYSLFPYRSAAPVSTLERETGSALGGVECRWEPSHPGALKSWCWANPAQPGRNAFVTVDAPNVILCAVKLPEDAFSPFALVVRLREVDGSPTRCRVGLPAEPRSAVRADHLERPSPDALPVRGREVTVDLGGYEIVTFLAYL